MKGRIHRALINVLMSLLVWSIVDYFIIPISFWQFVVIEIFIGIGELFSIFVKDKFGILNPDSIKFLSEEKERSENGL
jgi:hypothetical protein